MTTEKDGAKPEHVFCELLLKFGQPLTTAIEKLDIAGVGVLAIKGRTTLFILESFTLDMIEPLLAMKPKEIITLDSVFTAPDSNVDQIKSNLELACRDANVRFTCV